MIVNPGNVSLQELHKVGKDWWWIARNIATEVQEEYSPRQGEPLKCIVNKNTIRRTMSNRCKLCFESLDGLKIDIDRNRSTKLNSSQFLS